MYLGELRWEEIALTNVCYSSQMTHSLCVRTPLIAFFQSRLSFAAMKLYRV